jgi:hypothetical protein
MTREEYTMLRSIAEADGMEGPNFDPALLTELLDAYDALEKLYRLGPRPWMRPTRVTWPEWDEAMNAAEKVLGISI